MPENNKPRDDYAMRLARCFNDWLEAKAAEMVAHLESASAYRGEVTPLLAAQCTARLITSYMPPDVLRQFVANVAQRLDAKTPPFSASVSSVPSVVQTQDP